MWMILMAFLAFASLGSIFYIIHCFHRCTALQKLSKDHKILSYLLSCIPIAAILLFGLINYMAIVVVMLHLVVFLIVGDLIALIVRKIKSKNDTCTTPSKDSNPSKDSDSLKVTDTSKDSDSTRKIDPAKNFKNFTPQTLIAVLFCAVYLCIGWYNAHHVTQTEYTLYTDKALPGDTLRIVAIADSHMSITLNKDNFAYQCERIQQTNPDLVVIVGDFVDDESTKEDMTAACEALGKIQTTYGVYFVYGNHDRGYYGAGYRDFTAKDLENTLIKNNITILTDQNLLIDDTFYISGRLDKWVDKNRLSAQELTKDLDHDKYILMLDHQPNDFKNETAAGPDLVICGHTHGGHIFPTGTLSQWLGFGKVDLLYGKKHLENTDFIVTSGISGWAMPFKTGTFSEYVVIEVKTRIVPLK